ncbi:MAG: hypothetical protein WDN06_03920 [Asticcacaulis sp.]
MRRFCPARLADADKNLASIACYEDETGDVIRMAREALGQNGVALTSAAMDIFAQRLPKERGIAHQEIERLILFIGPGSHQTLTETDLQDFLGVEPEASLFKAAFDAFGGRMKQARPDCAVPLLKVKAVPMPCARSASTIIR